VKWEDKLRYFKRFTGYNPLSTWVNGEPSPLTWELLKRYRVAVPCIGDINPLNPRGSGYYGVVRLDLADHASLYMEVQIRTVSRCKEQLLNRYDYEYVEAWPTDTLAITPAPSAGSSMPSILEGVFRRNGLWAQVEDELVGHADMEPSEYSDASSVSSRLDRVR